MYVRVSEKSFVVLHLQLEYKRLEYFHFIVTSANTMDAEHMLWRVALEVIIIIKTFGIRFIDEALTCVREDGNPHDRYAVAVSKDARVVGHVYVARKISTVCYLFLRKGGIMSCVVMGTRRYSIV